MTARRRWQADKATAGLVSAEDDALYVEGFAAKLFASADSADRAGRSDVAAATKFYAASVFFDVARQFGDVCTPCAPCAPCAPCGTHPLRTRRRAAAGATAGTRKENPW